MPNIEQVEARVAIQGQDGSYHDKVGRYYFGSRYKPIYNATFREVFKDVDNGQATHGIVAIENSLYGSIAQVYDLFQKFSNIVITGETYLNIHHALIGLPNTSLADISEIHSHPVALAQCEEFMHSQLPEVSKIPGSDTASSLALIRKLGKRSSAAIASPEAADKYGLQILQTNIEDNPENYTRFLTIEPKKRAQFNMNADKSSLVIHRLSDDKNELKAGTLHNALGCFALQAIGLTKIESRPIIGRAWRYNFYLDCSASETDRRMQSALHDLRTLGAEFKVLGSYEQGQTIA